MIDIIINVLMKILFQTRQHRPLKHFIFVCRILGNKVHVNAVNELALKCHSRNNAQLYVRLVMIQYICYFYGSTHKINFGTIFFLKEIGPSRPLFLYFLLFNTVDSKMFNLNFCWWRNSNRRPLELEATTLPTEPQPLPKFWYYS